MVLRHGTRAVAKRESACVGVIGGGGSGGGGERHSVESFDT